MINIIKAQSVIGQTKSIIEKNNYILEKTGGMFNIFSILNMERLEVQTHSAVLYALLNKEGSHRQGDIYLKIFLKEVLNIDEFDFSDVKIEYERNIGELGRIDLVIENINEMIIIEIKIDAVDQEKQLKRYDEYGRKSGKGYKIYYLTLNGGNASEYSLDGENIQYECISFEVDILNWINKCVNAGNTPMLPAIRETLIQYSKLLEKITGQLQGGVKMEIKELLLKDNNLDAAIQISKAIPYCISTLEYKLWKTLNDKYSKKIISLGYEYVDDDYFKDEKADIENLMGLRNKKSGDLYFQYKIGEYKGMEVYVTYGLSGYDKTVYVEMVLIDGEDYVSYKKYDENMLSIIGKLGFDRASEYKYMYLNTEFDCSVESIVKLQDKEYFDGILEKLGSEIFGVMKRVADSDELKEVLEN